MGQLVDDLLFMARSETDQIRIEHARLSVRKLIKTAGQEAKILARRKQIEVRATLPDASLSIMADERRLLQALIILLDNAIRYSSAGGEVMLEASRDGDGDGDTVEILVRDHGLGIPAEDATHLFERFYRGAAARRLEPSGSGLGLAIAKWIVEEHGGGISLTSKDGTTEARMRLPIRDSL